MKEQKFSFSHTFEVETSDNGFQEFTYEVEAVYYPEERGTRDSLGAPEEPDYAAYVEILSLTGQAGNSVEFKSLEKEQQEELLDKAYAEFEGEYCEEY